MKLRINGIPDMRYGENKAWAKKERKELIKACLLAILLAFLVACAGVTFLSRPRTFSEPLEINPEYVEPEMPLVERNCYRNIDKIRCIGEDLGYDNNVIKTMIRIARSESNFRAEAKNPNSTASGIFQIIYGTWNGNKCEGSAFDAEDNINCAFKIYARRGFQPWASSASSWLVKR